MSDRAGQSFTDANSGFTGECDPTTGACTGTFSDGGKFINVQTVMRFGGTITDAGSAGRILDSLDDALGYARIGSAAASLFSSGQTSGQSVDQAQLAVDTARAQLSFDVSDWQPNLVDALAKTAIALNQLGAGSITLQFAQARLAADLGDPTNWNWINYLVSAGLVIIGVLFLWRLAGR